MKLIQMVMDTVTSLKELWAWTHWGVSDQGPLMSNYLGNELCISFTRFSDPATSANENFIYQVESSNMKFDSEMFPLKVKSI